MEGEHTSTIIQLILSTDLAVIQLKDSHLFFIFLNNIAGKTFDNQRKKNPLGKLRICKLFCFFQERRICKLLACVLAIIFELN